MLNMKQLYTLLLLLIPFSQTYADKYDDVVNDPKRSAKDTARDGLREPAKVLRFIGIEAGARILDVGAGGGYYTELLAGLVGDKGQVLLQNPSVLYQLFGNIKESLEKERLANNRLPNVTIIEDELLKLNIKDNSLDMVFFHLFYHDMFWIHLGQAREFNTEISRVLKPGGRVVIVDHAAPAGSKDQHAKKREGETHRIEAVYVEKIMRDASLNLIQSSGMLHNHSDDRSQAFFSKDLRGKKTDRFFHIYQKPLK